MVLENHGSRKILGESRNLGVANLKLAKSNACLGISNFEIESPSLANQAKVLISLNRHKITATTTAKQRARALDWRCKSPALGFLDHGVSPSDF